MVKKPALLALSVLLFIALACGNTVSAAPGSLAYNRYFDLDGLIFLKMLAGTAENGGQHKTAITGQGQLSRIDQLIMSEDYIKSYNSSDWTADPGSAMGMEVASTFRPFLNNSDDNHENVPQVFAVSVKAIRGERGSLSQNISSEIMRDNDSGLLDDVSFIVEQYAGTSDGKIKRYIDLVEPVSGQYIFEDSLIKGYASITDSLNSESDNNQAGLNSQVRAESIIDHTASVEELEELVTIIDGGESFYFTVDKGIDFSDLPLPGIIILGSGEEPLFEFIIHWQEASDPLYDSLTPGQYVFAGEIILPDFLETEGKYYLLSTVEVLEDSDEEIEISIIDEDELEVLFEHHSE